MRFLITAARDLADRSMIISGRVYRGCVLFPVALYADIYNVSRGDDCTGETQQERRRLRLRAKRCLVQADKLLYRDFDGCLRDFLVGVS